MTSTSCREPVLKVVGGLHCFGPEIIGKSTVNEHFVLHCDNSSPSSFGKPVFFVYIWGCIFDCDPTLFAKGAEFDGDEFSSIVCP